MSHFEEKEDTKEIPTKIELENTVVVLAFEDQVTEMPSNRFPTQ